MFRALSNVSVQINRETKCLPFKNLFCVRTLYNAVAGVGAGGGRTPPIIIKRWIEQSINR